MFQHRDRGGHSGGLKAAAPEESVTVPVSGETMWWGVLAIILSLVVGLVATKSITRPIEQLRRTARSIASNARDLLGGNGILLENRVARHLGLDELQHG